MTKSKKKNILGNYFRVIDCEHKTAPSQSEGVPLIRTPNIGNGRLIVDNVKYVSDETYTLWTRRAIPKQNDLIMAREAPVGNVAIINQNQKVCLGQRTVLLRQISDELVPQYLNYLLNSSAMKSYLIMLSNGATVGHLNVGDIRKLELPNLPQIATQKKIAAILSAYDELIENNKRRIAILEQMAEEIYREWFVRMRFPGYQNSKFEKGIPEGWQVSHLEEIVNFTMGQSPKSEFYNDIGDGLPFHQGVGTYGKRFPISKIFCSVKGRMANEGDILFSVRAPVGRLNIADTKMIIGRGLAALSHKQGWNSYLFYLLKAVFSDEDIIGNGAIFNAVTKDELKRFTIISPDEKLVEKFQNMALNIDKQIAILLKSLKVLEQTKASLLPRLISGKLSVENLNIEFPPGMKEH